jgi:hypothetical protein
MKTASIIKDSKIFDSVWAEVIAIRFNRSNTPDSSDMP